MKNLKILVLTAIVIAPLLTLAQNSILPFTGAKLFSNGIKAGTILTTVDGYQLVRAASPANKELLIRFSNLSGLTKDANKYYPAAEVTITNSAGAVLSKIADGLGAAYGAGVTADKLKDIAIKITPTTAILKGNNSFVININITDKKSKNGLKLTMPLSVGANVNAVASAGVAKVDSDNNADVFTNNVNTKKADIETDDKIRVDPSMLYVSIELENIAGVSQMDVLAGTETYYVYDATTLAPVANPGKLLKSVKGSMEAGSVSSYIIKIPFRKKTDSKKYVVRFRWEGKDGKRMIECITGF